MRLEPAELGAPKPKIGPSGDSFVRSEEQQPAARVQRIQPGAHGVRGTGLHVVDICFRKWAIAGRGRDDPEIGNMPQVRACPCGQVGFDLVRQHVAGG